MEHKTEGTKIREAGSFTIEKGQKDPALVNSKAPAKAAAKPKPASPAAEGTPAGKEN